MVFLPTGMGLVLCTSRQDDDRKSKILHACIDMLVLHMEQYILLPCIMHACFDSAAASCIFSLYVGLYVYSGVTLLCSLWGNSVVTAICLFCISLRSLCILFMSAETVLGTLCRSAACPASASAMSFPLTCHSSIHSGALLFFLGCLLYDWASSRV